MTFDESPSGKIYITNFRGSQQGSSFLAAAGTAAVDSITDAAISTATTLATPRVIEQGNVIDSVQFVPSAADVAAAAMSSSGTVRLSVRTQTAIPSETSY